MIEPTADSREHAPPAPPAPHAPDVRDAPHASAQRGRPTRSARRGRPSGERHARRGALTRALLLSTLTTASAGGVIATTAGAASPTGPGHSGDGGRAPAVTLDAALSATTSYTVRWGDTLSAIALRFGTTVSALAAANGIADPNLIFAGQVLAIAGSDAPAAAPVAPAAPAAQPATTRYTVRWGDTLSAIAARFGTTVSALATANGIADPNLIFAGQVLVIGQAAPRSAAPVPEAAPQAPAAVQVQAAPAVTGTAATLLSTMPSGVQAMFACIVRAESGGNPEAYNPASGAMGLLQFLEGTWLTFGGAAYGSTPLQATAQQQMNIGVRTYEADGFRPWSGDGCVA